MKLIILLIELYIINIKIKLFEDYDNIYWKTG